MAAVSKPDVGDDALLSKLLSLLPPTSSLADTARSTSSSPAHSHPRLSVVLNPHAGARQAEASWRTAAALLHARGLSVDEEAVSRTERAGDGERIGRELRQRWSGDGERAQGREVLVVLGGDGTVHEVLNGLLLVGSGGIGGGGEDDDTLWEGAGRVEVILVPAGTANALYHHLFPPESPSYPPDAPAAPFHSLLSFLRSISSPPSPSSTSSSPVPTLLPLPLALNALPSPCPRRTLTTVVSSAALHAALLHDAEELRATHPGVERFKIAARQNVDRWWEGEVRLSGRLRRYDPATRAWVPAAGSPRASSGAVDGATDGDGARTVIGGPFAYLVAALVSRFEPSFVVAPFRSPSHPLAPHPERDGGRPSIDVVAIRPLRHAPTAALARGSEEDRRRAREGFVERVWSVTGGMYDGGSHVDEVYGEGEAAEEEGAEGRAVCEVWRAERVEWVPVAKDDDLKSRLVCLDGVLHDLGASGGSLRVRAVGGGLSSVRVWT
ncbi:uncharacterized protein RHOBADRAFT_54357 [Rhodotorula graminis WP1]|uniref:DAGKc domain-containing protein n=1 Tax=Rhodotorula graminis (strain WP1) TaxID=578459 RepID=A0A194S559_RHOGW|nr:uncharacterized protein RHOBADRAFT_54357 [Rhodotorula graminis WP1]KPV74551.1 hypothetical protein RHOBADRAFT_54357 [Rhodotorula graminis WP1]